MACGSFQPHTGASAGTSARNSDATCTHALHYHCQNMHTHKHTHNTEHAEQHTQVDAHMHQHSVASTSLQIKPLGALCLRLCAPAGGPPAVCLCMWPTQGNPDPQALHLNTPPTLHINTPPALDLTPPPRPPICHIVQPFQPPTMDHSPPPHPPVRVQLPASCGHQLTGHLARTRLGCDVSPRSCLTSSLRGRGSGCVLGGGVVGVSVSGWGGEVEGGNTQGAITLCSTSKAA
jgi:hypothetical protein